VQVYTSLPIIFAGVNPSTLRGTNVGVFTGTCFSETEKIWYFENVNMEGLGVTNCSRSSLANRISYYLGLVGKFIKRLLQFYANIDN